MNRARPRPGLVLALVTTAACPTAGQAQDAYTYTVRDAKRVVWSNDGPPALDVSGDRDPVRVVQGPEFTWVVREGDSLAVQNAVMILHDNVPVRPEPGALMVEGWPPAPDGYEVVSMSLTRGARDRQVGGRTGRHYRFQARVAVGAGLGDRQRLDFTAHFWILPGIPHSWAPFGYGRESLPGVIPGLRTELDRRLAELGLVGRAVIRLRYTGQEGSGSQEITGFEISDLQAADPPRGVAGLVPQTLLDTLQSMVLDDPGPVCAGLARGEIPGSADAGLDDRARKTILAQLNDRCGRPEVYFGLLEGRLRSDTEALCANVAAARDPEALAAAVFTEAQDAAFMEFVTETDRGRFLAEVQQYCEARPR